MKPILEQGYFGVGLDNPKNSMNVGAALRAVGVYGGKMIAISNHRYSKASSDTMTFSSRLPLLQCDNLHGMIPFNCIPVAVDIVDGAVDLRTYKHPKRAFYVFGAEDATLGARVLDWCRDTVYVPTNGCMNLAATVNVVLYDRMLKEANNESNT